MNRLMTLVFAAWLLAGGAAFGGESDANKKDHEELRGLLKIFTDAFNTQNIDPLIPYLHKNFSVTMVNQDVVTTPEALKTYLHNQLNAPGSPLKDVKIAPENDLPTVFFDGRLGLNRGGSTDTYTLKDGRVYTLKSRWSGTAIYDEGKWKVLNVHIGANILDNPVLNEVEKLKYVWGGGGLAIGLIVGALGVYAARRKRA